MPRKSRSAVTIALPATAAVLMLAGCTGPALEADRAGDPGQAAVEEPAVTTEKSAPSTPVNHASTAMHPRVLAAMVDDLARRLAVASADIAVRKAVPVVWNDGSLGCPEPGMAYAQVLTEGYWAILEAGGQRYSYHASNRGGFRLCEGARPGPDDLPPGGRYAGEAS